MKDSIRDKMILSFGMNYGDTREKVDEESSPAKLPSTRARLWEKVLKRLVVSTNYKAFPSKITSPISQTLNDG